MTGPTRIGRPGWLDQLIDRVRGITHHVVRPESLPRPEHVGPAPTAHRPGTVVVDPLRDPAEGWPQ